MKQGKLTVITGPMKSGKSEEIARRIRRFQLAKKKVIVFAPDLDRHLEEGSIQGRDGGHAQCIAVPYRCPGYIRALVADDDAVVVIDEAQFFECPPDSRMNGITEVAVAYRDMGKTVIIAGLDLDSDGNAFGEMPFLLAQADEVVKLKAVCEDCGADAGYTAATFEKSGQISVPESGYVAVCRSCFLKRQQERRRA